MKKVIIVLLLLPLVNCTDKKKELSTVDVINESKNIDKTKELLETKLQGIYEYVYEHNSEDLIENHYMEFKENEATAKSL